MKIKYSPFIDSNVLLTRITSPDLNGCVVLHGSILGKSASLTLDVTEAARIFRALRDADIEVVERLHAGES